MSCCTEYIRSTWLVVHRNKLGSNVSHAKDASHFINVSPVMKPRHKSQASTFPCHLLRTSTRTYSAFLPFFASSFPLLKTAAILENHNFHINHAHEKARQPAST